MSITRPKGFVAAGVKAGIKPSGKPDLALIVRTAPDGPGAAFAATFTTNVIVGAPIEIALGQRAAALAARVNASGAVHAVKAFLINAGNSNSATGQQGVRDAHECMAALATALNCERDRVMPSSTGVIGRLLPTAKIVDAVPALVQALASGPQADASAAAAIMTTDLVPKAAFAEVVIGGAKVSIGAIAKGSGMIAPRLDSASGPPPPSATMLAFITTDAAIDSPTLQTALDAACGASFNRISVDNHPSCSDTAAILSSGLVGPPIRASTREFAAFAAALQALCEDLAEQIVTDGEGATRTFRVVVEGAATDADAERMAREVVNSPLVKCAIHGRDPNWGRIVTAAGNAGVRFDPLQASLAIGPVVVYRSGVPLPEALVDPRLPVAMASKRVDCVLRVGTGPGRAWMIGCDLSAQYVSINADYTT
ncbi:MAG: bifunctional glutamate N-acetyltransferase/amino-acid acetyltransferase ArgJ [Phycisphaerales bacterium]